MKTALKILGGIVVAIVALILVFYIGWLRPPAADKVCENVEKLTLAELESQGAELPEAMREELHSECMDHASNAPEFGIGPWVAELKCARDAESFAALEKCDV